MSEQSRSGATAGSDPEQVRFDELKLWVSWLQEVAAAGSDIAALMQVEVRLALGNMGRIVVLVLLLLPLSLLLWVAMGACIAWMAYQLTGAVILGLLTFAGLQLLLLAAILAVIRSYSRTLGLPRTRRHLQGLVREVIGETQAAQL